MRLFVSYGDHPIFCDVFSYCLDVDVVKVDPETNRIEADDSRNSNTQVWLECGPAVLDENGIPHQTHDIYLDCGGNTFEESIVHLALLVKEKYGDYE